MLQSHEQRATRTQRKKERKLYITHHPSIHAFHLSLYILPVPPRLLPALVRLPPILPASRALLVSAHACAELDVHSGRHVEAKALGDLFKIQRIHIKHAAETMARIRLQVASIAVLGGAMQVVVLTNQLLQLGLDVDDLLDGKVKFDHRYARCFELAKERELVRLQEQQGAPGGVGAACGSSDAVDVVTRVVGGVYSVLEVGQARERRHVPN
jgi:hypothetical protein